MRFDMRRGVLCAACGIMLTFPVRAADVISATAPTVEPVVTDGWTFSVTPYFWAAGLSGETSAFGLPVVVDIDADFSDVLGQSGFCRHGNRRRAQWPLQHFRRPHLYQAVGRSATPRGVLATSVDVTAETFAGLVGAGYSVLEGPSGHLDIVGGIRVWSVDTIFPSAEDFWAVSPSATGRPGSMAWSVSGAIIRSRLNSTSRAGHWLAPARPTCDWDVAGGLGYRINDRFSATLGYRALGVDYSNDDGFLFDVVQQGPIMGLTIRF